MLSKVPKWQANRSATRAIATMALACALVAAIGAVPAWATTESYTVDTVEFTSIAGDTRYDTMQEIAAEAYQGETSKYAVLATGDNYPDALAASSLAGLYNAPVVLVGENNTDQAIDTLTSLGVKSLFVIGGTAAISDETLATVEQATGATSRRISGRTRQETAFNISFYFTKVGWQENNAIIASGSSFPDALSASSLAYEMQWPIFLTNGDGTLSTETLRYLRRYDNVIIVGGEAAVPAETEARVAKIIGSSKSVTRLSGDNRYSTSIAIADYAVSKGLLTYDGVGLATGENFPDALAGSALCGGNKSVMLLVSNGSELALTIDALSAHSSEITSAYYMGGSSPIRYKTRAKISSIWSGYELIYDYEAKFINQPYTDLATPIFIKTDNPGASTSAYFFYRRETDYSVGYEFNVYNSAGEDMISSGTAMNAYSDIPYTDESVDWDSGTGLSVAGGWMQTNTFGISGAATAYIRELYDDGTRSANVAVNAFTIKDYEAEESAWMDKVISQVTNSSMSNEQKMNAIANYLLEKGTYPTNYSSNGGTVLLNLASEKGVPYFKSYIYDSYTSPSILVKFGEKLGYSLRSMYGDYRRGTSEWVRWHYYAEHTNEDGTKVYFKCCPATSSGKLNITDPSEIAKIDLTAL